MKNLIKKTLGYTLIFVSMILIMIMLGDKVSNDIYIPYRGTVILLICVAIFAILGTLILASILTKKELKANMMNTILWVIFLAYIIALLKVLFIDRTDMSSSSILYHADMRDINLIPFATIKLFMDSWNYGYLNKGLIITNIIGNIVIFAPMVVLLWSMFKTLRKKWIIILINFVIIIGVEIAQHLTHYGSLDIDDIILNMIGVVICAFIVDTKLYKKICEKIYIE